MFAAIMFVSTQAVHMNMSRHTKMSLKFSQVGNTPAYSSKGADVRSTLCAPMFALRSEKTSSQFTRMRVTLPLPPTFVVDLCFCAGVCIACRTNWRALHQSLRSCLQPAFQYPTHVARAVCICRAPRGARPPLIL